jgi:membrane protein DedA with SNARE-associated domain
LEDILFYINAHVAQAPYIIFGLLILAGLNIPVSEDAMIFISAILASKNPQYLTELFVGVYLGAYSSDIICYWLGRTLGPKLWKIRFFSKMVSPKKVDKMRHFYKKYGAFTLIFGRFIPFGVRNALFITAGLSKMALVRFMIFDFIACSISVIIVFTLTFHYGEVVIDYVKRFNLLFFSMVILLLLCFFIRKKFFPSNKISQDA